MMPLYLYNTLTKQKQEFKTADGTNTVRMYSCGPTVYNFLHIGNLRSYTFADTLKRVLIYNGYKVKHIMQVTDIGHIVADADLGEDKMMSALKREGKPMTIKAMREVADFYFDKAREDMNKMNIIPSDSNPFASDHIREDIEIISALLENNKAYKTTEAIYFDTKKFPNYGILGGAVAHDDHSRIGTNPEKKNSEDFALWKFSDESGIGYESPFGKGFPGWHIECSAMGLKYLGYTFDIHTGGIDLIPIHHNNEIAQSESYTGRKFVNFWMHNGFITIGNNQKMAKTGDNFVTLNFLEKNGVDALAYRYWLLTSKYSTRIDFSIEAIKASQVAYEKLYDVFSNLPNEFGIVNQNYKNKFQEFINDDLNTPKALALVWELVKDTKVSSKDKKSTLLDFDNVLGLMLDTKKAKNLEIPRSIEIILAARNEARQNKDWIASDLLRQKILDLGFKVTDIGNEQIVDKIR